MLAADLFSGGSDMKKRIRDAIRRLGTRVKVTYGSNVISGKAVILPERISHRDESACPEGIGEIQRFLMYASAERFPELQRGNIVSCKEVEYYVLQTTVFRSVFGDYIRARLGKTNSQGDDEAELSTEDA